MTEKVERLQSTIDEGIRSAGSEDAQPKAGSTLTQSLSTVRRRIATVVLSANVLVITIDMTILNIALPDLTENLKSSAIRQLWIVDVYSLVLAGLLTS